MNKKLLLSGISACLLILSLALTGCPTEDDSGGGGGKSLKVSGITAAQIAQASTFAGYGLFPPGTGQAQVITDVQAFFSGNATIYLVAGNNNKDYPSELVTVGASPAYTTTVRLRGANSAYGTYWNGSGTYDIWVLLLSGSTWTLYKKPGVSVTNSVTDITAPSSFEYQGS
jgi:hypothetical protein